MRNLQIVILAFFLLGCSSKAGPAISEAMSTPLEGGSGKIAFNFEVVSLEVPKGTVDSIQIYTMNADGSGQTSLTKYGKLNSFPQWSPDGSKIAFTSHDHGNDEICVMNADGRRKINLTRRVFANDTFPAWSPDGTQIAFLSDRSGYVDHRYVDHRYVDHRYVDQVYIMNADGSQQIQLTTNDENVSPPVWSPDGTQIAFSLWHDEDIGIIVMNADGSGQTRLTNNGRNICPVWSPDGTKIAFLSDRAEGHRNQIYIMNPDGSGQTRLTNNGHDACPVWSPDGTKIAFSSSIDGNEEIYAMNADGSEQIQLTNNREAEFSSPVWSPDGRKIIFVGYYESKYEIYVMNTDGGNLTKLTDRGGFSIHPAWSP